jgi:hypothetical protein
MTPIQRRAFLQSSLLASGSLLLSRAGAAQVMPALKAHALAVHLAIDITKPGPSIPSSYIGLSYEQSQLGNPNFFAETNTQLAGIMRTLGRHGVLRIGGNTSDRNTFWNRNAKPSLKYSDMTAGPDTGNNRLRRVFITPEAIRNLRDFLDRTGWALIYGLNLGKGTPQSAADEAAFVMETIGRDKVVAFQVGNEPDAFALTGLRPKNWSLQQYLAQWNQFYQSVKARVPDAPFAGPDTATNANWLMPFAKTFRDDIRFISSHYYAIRRPTGTINRLLSANDRLEHEMSAVKQVQMETGLPFRMTETNSCPGGKPGVSDTFAAALWAGDYMYQLAEAGSIGINFHGGGYGWYTPIAGTPEAGFLARPEYYGLLLFAQAGPGRLVSAKLSGTEAAPLLKAYALRGKDGHLRVALFNKNEDKDVVVKISGSAGLGATLMRLEAPRLDDTTDVTFGGSVVGVDGRWLPMVEEPVPSRNGLYMVHMKKASGALVTFS